MHVHAWLVGSFLVLAACARGPSPAAPRLEGATLTYLGVAGWSLASPAGTLLVDPYVTRTRVDDEDAPLAPDVAAIKAYVPARADAVLVAHSHYDHLLDVPAIATRTGAIVVGTESTANAVRAGGVAEERIRVARPGDALALGPFRVDAVAALHALTGQANAPIARGVRWPPSARELGEGGTLQYLVRFEGHAVYFVSTANFREDDVRAIGARFHPDVAVVAVGLRGKIPDYTCRLLTALGRPALVLPNHWDAFREPIRAGHMEPDDETRDDLAAFAAEAHACAPGTRVEVPVHFRPIPL